MVGGYDGRPLRILRRGREQSRSLLQREGRPGRGTLWFPERKRELELAFSNPVPGAAESVLRLDDVTLRFPVESSSTAFTFTDVDISWTEGQVVAVSIVQ